MMNSRYVIIKSCYKCKYNGHTGKLNICSNPCHRNMKIACIKIDKEYYPITSNDDINAPIPEWCTLPKDVK